MKVFVKAQSADEVVCRADEVQEGELIVYSLIDVGENVFRCQIGVFAPSVAECRAIAEAFCSEVGGSTPHL